MFGHLKKFLKGSYAVSANNAQQAMDEMHIELMALPEVRKDFTTPEGAILCLEDAYRSKDLEAAVAAKDFKTVYQNEFWSARWQIMAQPSVRKA